MLVVLRGLRKAPADTRGATYHQRILDVFWLKVGHMLSCAIMYTAV